MLMLKFLTTIAIPFSLNLVAEANEVRKTGAFMGTELVAFDHS